MQAPPARRKPDRSCTAGNLSGQLHCVAKDQRATGSVVVLRIPLPLVVGDGKVGPGSSPANDRFFGIRVRPSSAAIRAMRAHRSAQKAGPAASFSRGSAPPLQPGSDRL
ncbi:MAG: hypothetical protein C0524_14365 [Rhodobacter sp.]|nr:hypothetical protein [Rhodobacter sp.]